MAHPDPKSFDTLEKAQAEIARLYAKEDRTIAALDGIVGVVGEMQAARANIAKLLGEERV